ncbi:MAG: 4-oxalomesaconate tautomerase [Rhodospirillales bacterium]|nr:4-oxalomesaconate tautomerase [Rhodospirillales bacterium]
MTKQTAIPCVMMRGGTSRGPYFHLKDLPDDADTRDRVLLAAMGSPHPLQVDGIGGTESVTSKVAMVGPSTVEDCDVDYFFAQVSVDQPLVDTGPTCGNMLSGIGPFAIESGLVEADDGETVVRIHSVNTGAKTDAVVQTPGGVVDYEGDTAIDGVPGTSAPVLLRMREVDGSKTNGLLPTGKAREDINGIDVTCMDVAMPMVIMRAADLGVTGFESKEELDQNSDLIERFEVIRMEAGRRMGMGDVTGKVTPKVGLLAAPRNGGSITSRYFVPQNCHPSHAVTGGICVATCAVMEGTVADGLSVVERTPIEQITIEHPLGDMFVELSVDGHGPDMTFGYGGITRTARPIFVGSILVPAAIWDGR